MGDRWRVTGVTEAGQPLMRCGCDGGASGNQRWVVLCPLHAAAPDLLAALEALADAKEGDEIQIEGEWGLSTDPGYGKPSPELVVARAAIAKAKGEA